VSADRDQGFGDELGGIPDDLPEEIELLPADLSEVAELLTLGPSDVTDEQPSPSLWAGIEAELLAEQAPPGEMTAEVVSLDAARSKRKVWLSIAAGIAAVLLVGVPVGLALRESTTESVEIAAGADLSAVTADFTGSGAAELHERELDVETIGLDPLDGSAYELWLLEMIDGKVNDLVWVGFIDADGTYVIGDDVDLDRFTVVDISIEPMDGDPTHSGNSVLRGELTTL
jgi:anti-sigma-K factor RskA